MGKGDAGQREDEWGDGDERSSSDEVRGIDRGKRRGQSWIAARGER